MPPTPTDLLTRPDKWYLGCGDGLIWAPPFPLWPDAPGFWDEAHLAQHRIQPLFTVSFVAPDGTAPRMRARTMAWSPAELRLEYLLPGGLEATEVRSAPGDRTLASEWSIRNRSRRPRTLHLVVWTAVDGATVADGGVSFEQDAVSLTRTVTDRKEQRRPVTTAIRISGGAASWAAYRSEASGANPEFSLTPFYDRWPEGGGLRNESRLGGIDHRGLVYAALHRRLTLQPGGRARFVADVQVTPEGVPVPPDRVAAEGSRPGSRRSAPSRVARAAWMEFTRQVPTFRSSDPFANTYWWYRWYGLRLNSVPAGLGQYASRSVCEGIGYFHQPISYSAMCHAREVRWAHDPLWARGVIETFFSRLGPDGSMPGRVYLDHLTQPDFYHADWGGAIADVEAVHPDGAWVRRLYPQLARYASWLTGTRDAEGSGMIDVTDQFETGQEYMSRYEVVDPDADRYGWENRIRLKGIDVTVYAYRLLRLLARIAPAGEEAKRWTALAERSRSAVRERMWDAEAGLFSDVDPATGSRTGVKASVCFYPYLCDLAGAEHTEAMARHLFDPGEFWTPFPAPSSSVDDPRFNADAEWKGKRHVCPWNGRVWPMTNSHLADALARVVRTHRPDLAHRLVHLVRQFLRMMTFGGDPARPNCFEHYHPFTGRASVYRGIDDYQHSWVNDLLVRQMAGLLPRGERGFVVDPMPFGVDVELREARVAGHRVDIAVRDGAFRVRVDDRAAGRGIIGRALEVAW
jgi:hypothetical protein